jgi:hypothetical protein
MHLLLSLSLANQQSSLKVRVLSTIEQGGSLTTSVLQTKGAIRSILLSVMLSTTFNYSIENILNTCKEVMNVLTL